MYKGLFKMFSGFLIVMNIPLCYRMISYNLLGIPILKKILNMKIFINFVPPLLGTKNCPEVIVYRVKNQQNLNMFEYK